jgi:predicted HTH transcriptional regulator
VVEESFENLAYSWEMFLVTHFHHMKKLHFGDYDSYIIMQVINSHFIYNKRKDYEKTNQNSWIQLFDLASSKYRKQIMNEKNKLTVSSISRVTSIPLETVRRKIQKLCQNKVIETNNNSITL